MKRNHNRLAWGEFVNLDDVYQDLILDHYKSPRCKGVLLNPDRKVDLNNPLCGDQISLTLKFSGDTIAEIADLYRLSKKAKNALQPVIAGQVQTGLAGAVSMAKATVGLDALAISGKGADAAKSAIALVKMGPKAAKAHPILAAASVAYAVGSAGWFAFHARAFNRAAYEMVKATIPVAPGADEQLPPGDLRPVGAPLLGRLKDFAKRKRGSEPN
jgi:hypothetical protein